MHVRPQMSVRLLARPLMTRANSTYFVICRLGFRVWGLEFRV